MTRDDLKSLVKECLLEIIIEGSPKSVVESVRERKSGSRAPAESRPTVSRPALDLIHPNGVSRKASPPRTAQPAAPPRARAENYRELTGGNAVMAEIFADTASSGLVERIGSAANNENTNPYIDTGVDPTLFEGADNWATIAFSDSKTSSRR